MCPHTNRKCGAGGKRSCSSVIIEKSQKSRRVRAEKKIAAECFRIRILPVMMSVGE